MALNLPPLPAGQPITDANGQPTLAFSVYWQQLLGLLEGQEATQDALIQALADAVAAVEAAQAAADTANEAAALANTAASDAATAASGANAAIDQIEAGNFDLAAITINGQRFINDGGTLVVEP